MKKFLIAVFALALAIGFSSASFAKDGLSADFGLGYKNNVNDAQKDLYKALATQVTAKNASTPTVSSVSGDQMYGIDFALHARYDFMNSFFARVGFNYTVATQGTYSYTTVSTGEVTKYTYDYSAWAIPVVFGLNIPVLDGKVNFYGGLGVAFGGVDYIYKTTASLTPANNVDATYSASGFGFTYVIGTDAQIMDNLSLYIELENTFNVLGKATDNKAVANSYDARKLQIGGQIMRVGAKYFIM